METWKDIVGYEGLYQVSSNGRIRSCGNNGKKPRILTQEINEGGYCRIRLYDSNHKSKHFAVHRIVASAFIGDCDTLVINHKNEIKTDNRVENLEIVTIKENCNYGTRNERISKARTEYLSKPVEMIDKKTGNRIKTYPSRLVAEKETGIDNSHICMCCAGKRKTAGGYKWKEVI